MPKLSGFARITEYESRPSLRAIAMACGAITILLNGCGWYGPSTAKAPLPLYVHRGAVMMRQVAANCANQPAACATAGMSASKECPSGGTLDNIMAALKKHEPAISQAVICNPSTPVYNVNSGSISAILFQTMSPPTTTNPTGCRDFIYYNDSTDIDVPSDSCN